MVNLVSFAIKQKTPAVVVSFNYRVGLLGFLASNAIKQDLVGDGFHGTGNFGLTDQLTALEWVQRHVCAFGGNPDNVTIFGESDGVMSVAHQIWAKQPAVFHRGIGMSGALNSILVWPLEKHESRWEILLEHFGIDLMDTVGWRSSVRSLKRYGCHFIHYRTR
ncbi:Carboxylesterase family-domain-containing protein [Ilyonectria destructans]|nr:Carboxylesterase family-domain-containing protein [Ilyonectria destructans]